MELWTEKKWRSLPLEQQHRRAADLVRRIYVERTPSLFAEYEKLAEWSGWPPLSSEAVADRFHDHLREGGRSIREHDLLPQLRRGDREEGEPFLPIAIYLDRLRSAHNVGSIFRTAEAFRVGRLYLSPTTPGPEQKGVRDAAMGTTEWVPWERASLSELPRPILAFEPAEGVQPLYHYPFPSTCTLVIGNEEEGCSPESLALASDLIEIPLVGRKNSLNVANAFAVIAAEIRRSL